MFPNLKKSLPRRVEDNITAKGILNQECALQEVHIGVMVTYAQTSGHICRTYVEQFIQ